MSSIKDYFDRYAERWDGYQKAEDAPVIREILRRAGISEADDVLDVACGTGVLAPFLAELGVKSLAATDISPKMAGIYGGKFPFVSITVGDYETRLFPDGGFSRVVIFNAFPHFGNGKAVFENSFRYLKPGGRLVIAHSMNRERLDEHHRKAGMEVADHVLISDDEFRRLYAGAGFGEVVVENSAYFFSSGVRS